MNEGKCYLREEDSLSSSDYFREHKLENVIYFENGCDISDDDVDNDGELLKESLLI